MSDALFPIEWGDRSAIIVEPGGETASFAELETASNQAAHFYRDNGLRTGDTVALVMENRIDLLYLAFGAQRAGLYYVVVNHHLTAHEAEYVVSDSGAAMTVTSEACREIIVRAACPRFIVDSQTAEGGTPLDLREYPDTPIADQAEGDFLLYSSGTTGRPKGIERKLSGGEFGTYPDLPGTWLSGLLGLRPGDAYLTPAPLYHAAPLGWTMGALRHGATAVVMKSFDPAHALELIELHRVTHSQWVPTMFVRMLKLPSEIRERFDLSSHRWAIHAAAACPVHVKREMIDWWGPILFEFYSSTEGVGATSIHSDEWLKKPGSVGRPLLGDPVILDDDRRPVGTNEVGSIWFTGGTDFAYHGDPEKTASARDGDLATVGDLGWLDDDGYLFLADRRSDLIISGGVNIYPREIEDALIDHPAVLDVAVVGRPDEDRGQRVVAFVQPTAAGTDARRLADDLRSHCLERIAKFKVPREFRVLDELPRTPTGKLRKHLLPVD